MPLFLSKAVGKQWMKENRNPCHQSKVKGEWENERKNVFVYKFNERIPSHSPNCVPTKQKDERKWKHLNFCFTIQPTAKCEQQQRSSEKKVRRKCPSKADILADIHATNWTMLEPCKHSNFSESIEWEKRQAKQFNILGLRFNEQYISGIIWTLTTSNRLKNFRSVNYKRWTWNIHTRINGQLSKCEQKKTV